MISPECASSTVFVDFNAWCDLRMLRFDGVVFLFGTAILKPSIRLIYSIIRCDIEFRDKMQDYSFVFKLANFANGLGLSDGFVSI